MHARCIATAPCNALPEPCRLDTRQRSCHVCLPHAFVVHADEKGKLDEVVEDKGVRIIVDSRALMHLLGTRIDFAESKLG